MIEKIEDKQDRYLQIERTTTIRDVGQATG